MEDIYWRTQAKIHAWIADHEARLAA
jgi:hypothetical protein